MSGKRRSRSGTGPKKASRRAVSGRRARSASSASTAPRARAGGAAGMESFGNDFYQLYHFLFSKRQGEAEALIRKLQDVCRSQEDYVPSTVQGAMQATSDELDQELTRMLGCSISLTPDQREVLVTVLLNPYFQKVRPWNASSSTW